MKYIASTMDSLRSVRGELRNWSGSRARLWSYAVTHSILSIRLEQQGHRGNLHIECIGVVAVAGECHVGNCSISVDSSAQETERYSKLGLPYLVLECVSDRSLRVVCEDVGLRKDVEPIYRG